MTRKILVNVVVLLFMMSIASVNMSSASGESSEWREYSGYKVKILSVSPTEKAELTKGDLALIIVHGVIGRAKDISEDFAKGFASIAGANKVILFEYAPDHLYPGDVSAKWSDNAAAYKLADLTAKIISETGNDPFIYALSNGNSITNKASHFMQGKKSYLPYREPTDEMKKARWKGVFLASAHLRYNENLEDMEKSISGRTSNGDIPLYVFYSRTDIIARNGLGWARAKKIEFDILSYLQFENKEGLGFWTHAQWMNPKILPLYKEKLSTLALSKTSVPSVTFNPTQTPRPLPTTTIPPPPWDDGNSGSGGGLGGVDFTEVHLRSIYSNTSISPDGQFNAFSYVLKAKKAEKGDEIINPEDAAELSLNSFFTGLALPESEFWVNLNPWEPDRIIEKDLETTDVGRIMLEADLQMKKDFSRYEDPCESETGVEFWKLLGEKRGGLVKEIMKKHPDEIKDVNDVQFAPVTRHWIVPDKVEAYETDNEIYIVNATLNIFSEPVYEQSTYNVVNTLTLSKDSKEDLSEAAKEYGKYVKELQGKKILPLVVQEVNRGKKYSDLRQVYASLALAQWYKNKSWQLPSPFTDVMNSKNLKGLESKSVWSAESVWTDYKKSFEDGDYHCWKNRTYQQGDYTITESKLYSGGGVDFMDIKITNKGSLPQNLKELLSEAVYSFYAKDGDDHYFGDGIYVIYERNQETGYESDRSTNIPTEERHETIQGYSNQENNQNMQKATGFDAIFAIVGLLTVVYLIKKMR